jgi:quercetin dioxygenase-like cupin family protein
VTKRDHNSVFSFATFSRVERPAPIAVASSARGQPLPPGPTKGYESTIAVANPSARGNLIQTVLDFAPGTWTPFHRHGGQAFNLVLAGEITLRENNTEQIFKPGESWSDTPDQVYAAGNAGAAPARLLVTFLLPWEVPLTTVQQGGSSQQPPPGPTKVYESKVAMANPPAQADLIQVLLDFAPGAWTPPHTHGGQTLNTVLDGEITLRENNTEKIFKPGEGWSDTPNQVHAAGNAGATKTSLAVAFLLPKGAVDHRAGCGSGRGTSDTAEDWRGLSARAEQLACTRRRNRVDPQLVAAATLASPPRLRMITRHQAIDLPGGVGFHCIVSPRHLRRHCACWANVVAHYRNRISGPMLDRVDIHVEIGVITMRSWHSPWAHIWTQL